MVSDYIKSKARFFVHNKRVKIEYECNTKIYFTITYKRKQEELFYRKQSGKFGCTCKYFSLHMKACSHITACKMFLEQRRR